MSEQNNKTTEKKKGFWGRLVEKLDKSMESRAKKSGSDCCGGDDRKGNSCCS